MVRSFARARLALRGPVITGSYADILHVRDAASFRPAVAGSINTARGLILA